MWRARLQEIIALTFGAGLPPVSEVAKEIMYLYDICGTMEHGKVSVEADRRVDMESTVILP